MNQIEAFRETLNAVGDKWPETDNEASSLQHMYSMLARMEANSDPTAPDGFSEAKKGRWLGWMQGCAFCLGLISLEECKQINKKWAD